MKAIQSVGGTSGIDPIHEFHQRKRCVTLSVSPVWSPDRANMGSERLPTLV